MKHCKSQKLYRGRKKLAAKEIDWYIFKKSNIKYIVASNRLKIPTTYSIFTGTQLLLTAKMISKLPPTIWYDPKQCGKILGVPPKDIVIIIYLNDYIHIAQTPIRLNETLVPIIKADIQKQLDKGLLTKTINCPWTTAIYVVLKPKGVVRICGDYRQINQRA